MKDQATILFRRLKSGNVIGEIVDSTGKVVDSKNFGDLSDEEIQNVLEVFKAENPDVEVHPTIEISGN